MLSGLVLLFQFKFMEQSIPGRPRLRRTREQIALLLEQFRESGVTVKEFSRTHQISPGTFHKWQSRVKDQPPEPDNAPGFAKVQVDWSAHCALFAEVGGIKIYQRVEAAYLKSLLS
jgi:Transposase